MPARLKGLEQFAQEFLRRPLIPPRLNDDVDYFAVLVDGTPQIPEITVDHQEVLIEMPTVAGSRTMRTNPLGIGTTKLQTPFADGFIRHYDAALCLHLLHIAVTQSESKIQPHNTVADDLGGEAVPFVGAGRQDTRRSIHRPIKSR